MFTNQMLVLWLLRLVWVACCTLWYGEMGCWWGLVVLTAHEATQMVTRFAYPGSYQHTPDPTCGWLHSCNLMHDWQPYQAIEYHYCSMFCEFFVSFGRRHLFSLWRVFSSKQNSPFGIAYLHNGHTFEIVLLIDIFWLAVDGCWLPLWLYWSYTQQGVVGARLQCLDIASTVDSKYGVETRFRRLESILATACSSAYSTSHSFSPLILSILSILYIRWAAVLS